MHGKNKGIAISNIHPRIRLKDIIDIFSVFGNVIGFQVLKEGFALKFESFPEKSLSMDNFPLVHKRMKVRLIELADDYDTFQRGTVVMFNPSLDVDEIRDECCMFGCVTEVIRKQNGIYVICSSEADGESIFMNMYGRYYNKERIRCWITDEKSLLGE
ncbi:uncharacterized protein Eint_040090 [Encephalitozoon intestinalis ATCC 50506]|uniref:Uncharacterized protein n=1 Tax=Encephalitozoon intestinalis (strain ATCC 50506) TaxID=876142 RepID=E0S6G7_ENCIT|nr:uncharacterized protein Eint_040090 [Encephalitozoon intestinalis ATCC 50506]ADM11302.2 hypothetical protein Eint_040090 [Encephalitozoon intestinalis ATCC 50506]UTX44988.1 RRM domain-containing protein [Encephalitozoon intestinalis]